MEYAQLQTENAALRKDITEMVDLVNKLRNDNDTLRQHFENLKAAHIQLSERSNELTRELANTIEGRRVSELNHATVLQQLKAQLDAKGVEFDDLRERMLPTRELDLLRIRVAEELDAPHRVHVATLEAEIEKFRNLYFGLRRDHELLRAHFETQEKVHKDTLQEAEILFEAERQSLNSKISTLQASLEERTDLPRFRGLQRDLAEAQQRLRQTVTELEGLRADREKAKGDVALIERSYARQMADEVAARTAIQAEKEAIATKCMNLEAILADLQRSQNAASETISKLDTENANLRMQLDDLLARFRRQLDETSRANADTINRLEFEKLTHERLLDDMKKRLEDAQQASKDASTKLAILERDIAARIRRVRDEEAVVHRGREQELLDLIAQVQNMEKERQSMLLMFEQGNRDKEKEVADVLMRARNAENELASTLAKVQATQASIVEKEEELSRYKKMLEEFKGTTAELRKSLADLSSREQTLQGERDRSVSKATRIESEIATLTQQMKEKSTTEHKQLFEQISTQNNKMEKLQHRYTKLKQTYALLKERSSQVVHEQQHQIRLLTTKLEKADIDNELAKQLASDSIKMKQKLAELSAQATMRPDTLNDKSLQDSKSPHQFPWPHLVEEEHRTRSELASLHTHLSTLSQYQQAGLDSISSMSS